MAPRRRLFLGPEATAGLGGLTSGFGLPAWMIAQGINQTNQSFLNRLIRPVAKRRKFDKGIWLGSSYMRKPGFTMQDFAAPDVEMDAYARDYFGLNKNISRTGATWTNDRDGVRRDRRGPWINYDTTGIEDGKGASGTSIPRRGKIRGSVRYEKF